MSNRNEKSRGNKATKIARRQFIFDKFGNGVTCKCVRCGIELDNSTMTVDRHPIPGCCGGKYTRNNIRPACADCNVKMGAEHQKEKHQKAMTKGNRPKKHLTHNLGEYYLHGKQKDL